MSEGFGAVWAHIKVYFVVFAFFVFHKDLTEKSGSK
jgi:hypothetical protein